MIIQEQKQREVIKQGDIGDTTEMSIDQDSIGLLMGFLSKNIYQDGIGSCIRETVSNSFDALKASGKTDPILVSLNKLENYKWEFTVEDFALGLDDQDIKNIISKYLKSTKRLEINQLGSFGIGFKSPLAYVNNFKFRCRKNGIERMYMMYEGEFNNEIELLFESETTEKNGVKIIIDINYSDVSIFSSKIREQLCYFSNIFIKDDYRNINNDFKIFENNLFKWSELCPSNELHLCLGEVYYPLDFQKLGISRINVPVAIKIGLDENIYPTISREGIQLTPESKEKLLVKIVDVADWFINKYNESLKSFDNIIDAWNEIDNYDKNVIILDKKFRINNLIEYSNLKINEIQIKGIELRTPAFYKTIVDELMRRVSPLGRIEWNKRYKKISWINYSDKIRRKEKIVLVKDVISGHFREYLREEYGSNTSFAHLHDEKVWTLHACKKVLMLKEEPIERWRSLINEATFVEQQIFDGLFIDNTNLKESEGYKEYLEEKRQESKDNRELGLGTYKTLDKDRFTEVTIAYSRYHKKTSKVVFEKNTYKIADLYKNPYITILFDFEDKELASDWYHQLEKVNVKIALIGKREINRIPKLHNFKNLEEFMKTKAFRRIVTSWLVKKVLDKHETILKHDNEIAKKYLGKLSEDIKILNTYKSKNDIHCRESDIMEAMLDTAKELNLWDQEIIHIVHNVDKQLKIFEFLNYIQIPDYSDAEEIKKVKNLINQYLLFQKKFKGAFEGWELVNTESLEGELKEEEEFLQSEEAELLLN